MRIRDLMTTEVLTIGPEAPIRDVAKILVEHRISGLPVCSIERHVLGVVSEADILYKEHDPAAGKLGGPLGWILDGAPDAAAHAKAGALTAGDAMTAPAIVIAPHASVAAAARLLTEHRINRLPVVKDGVIVGIVTRADLVRAFTRPDVAIELEIRDEILGRTLWADRGRVEVTVARGAVTLAGELDRRSDAELLEQLSARVPGVVSVESSVSWRADDVTRRERRKLERTA